LRADVMLRNCLLNAADVLCVTVYLKTDLYTHEMQFPSFLMLEKYFVFIVLLHHWNYYVHHIVSHKYSVHECFLSLFPVFLFLFSGSRFFVCLNYIFSLMFEYFALENGQYGHAPIRSDTSIRVYTTADTDTDTSTPCVMVSH